MVNVGEWKDGLKNGQGTEIWTDSEPDFDVSSTYAGEFKYGQLLEGTITDKDGEVTQTGSEGVKIEK